MKIKITTDSQTLIGYLVGSDRGHVVMAKSKSTYTGIFYSGKTVISKKNIQNLEIL